MSLSRQIAQRFNLEVDTDVEWVSINCPFHNDKNASAGISFQHKMFNCLASCEAMPFKQFAKKLGIENESEDTDWLNDFISDMTPSRPMVLRKQAAEYANFLIERKIKPETIEELGGYYEAREVSNDYGYLVVPYGTTGLQIKKRIIGNGERFRNSTGFGKDLFGRNINSFHSIILVEGFTDYCTLWQQQYKNIVASFGAKVSKQQMYLLRNKIVFILFDTDYDGYSGARKAAKYLKEYGSVPIILEIPKRFGNEDDTKIDVNSAYCRCGSDFLQWLEESISQYSVYDNGFVSSMFGVNNGTHFNQFKTNLSMVDSILGGGFASGIHGIGGRTEVGKSSLVTHLITEAARQDKNVLALSYELSKEQMWARLASQFTEDTSWADIERGYRDLDSVTIQMLTELASKIKIELGWTIDQVLAAIDNFDVVVLDYIQRMEYEGNDRRLGITSNASNLSNLARDKGKIIIFISSMPNHEDVFKESGDLLYMCQSAWILRKAIDNVRAFENIKNTRNVSGKKVFLEMDFAHQRVRDSIPPNLNKFIREG